MVQLLVQRHAVGCGWFSRTRKVNNSVRILTGDVELKLEQHRTGEAYHLMLEGLEWQKTWIGLLLVA